MSMTNIKSLNNMFTTIDLCLLCLTNKTNLKNILSKDSDGEIVKEKLKCFLSKQTQIELEDSMLYICLPCLEKLNNVYNYKRLCLWNINRFNSFIQKLKSTDGIYSNLQVTLIDIKNINVNEVTCGSELNSDFITTENIEIDNETIKKEPNENETKLKVEKEDEIEFELVDEIVKEETEDNYDIFDVKSELYNDAFLNGTENNEESTSKSGSRNTDRKLHKCNKCQKSFTCRSNLIIHVRCHTGDKPYKCEVCSKSFSVKHHLQLHMRCHTGEKPYKCDICDKTFTQSSSLMAHKRRHTGQTPCKCEVCGKSFRERSYLQLHMRCHTGEKPFKCDVCNKAFSLKSTLVRHKVCHTGEKPYKCDVCYRAFSQKSNLVRHKVRHTGEDSSSAP